MKKRCCPSTVKQFGPCEICEVINIDVSTETPFHNQLHFITLSFIISYNNTLLCFIPHVVLPKLSLSAYQWVITHVLIFFPLFFVNTDTDVIRKQCPPLSQLHHGYTLKAIGSDGAVKSVEFSCNNSYVLSGNSKRTCQLDGTWNGRQPQCIKGICLFVISQYYASFSIARPE